jgi:hypothetical protein
MEGRARDGVAIAGIRGPGRGGRVADASLPEATRSARSADPAKRYLLAGGSYRRPYQGQLYAVPTLPGAMGAGGLLTLWAGITVLR